MQAMLSRGWRRKKWDSLLRFCRRNHSEPTGTWTGSDQTRRPGICPRSNALPIITAPTFRSYISREIRWKREITNRLEPSRRRSRKTRTWGEQQRTAAAELAPAAEETCTAAAVPHSPSETEWHPRYSRSVGCCEIAAASAAPEE